MDMLSAILILRAHDVFFIFMYLINIVYGVLGKRKNLVFTILYCYSYCKRNNGRTNNIFPVPILS